MRSICFAGGALVLLVIGVPGAPLARGGDGGHGGGGGGTMHSSGSGGGGTMHSFGGPGGSGNSFGGGMGPSSRSFGGPGPATHSFGGPGPATRSFGGGSPGSMGRSFSGSGNFSGMPHGSSFHSPSHSNADAMDRIIRDPQLWHHDGNGNRDFDRHHDLSHFGHDRGFDRFDHGRDFDDFHHGHFFGFGFYPFYSPFWYDSYAGYYPYPYYRSYDPYYDYCGYDYYLGGPQYVAYGSYAAGEYPAAETEPVASAVSDDSPVGGQFLSGARDAFARKQYAQAARLANHAGVEMPRSAKVHELLSLAMFAQADYRGANLEAHAALSLGPPSDWARLYAYYGDLPTYMGQLDALVKYLHEHPNSAEARFVLAYHDLMMGHREAAQEQLEKVVAAVPQDKLAGDLLKGKTPQVPETPPAPAAAAEKPADETAPAAPSSSAKPAGDDKDDKGQEL